MLPLLNLRGYHYYVLHGCLPNTSVNRSCLNILHGTLRMGQQSARCSCLPPFVSPNHALTLQFTLQITTS